MTVNQFIQALREEATRICDEDIPESEGSEIAGESFEYWVERAISEALERFVE